MAELLHDAGDGGEPWFVAADVCDALGLDNNRQAVTRLDDDDEKGAHIVRTPGGDQELTIINESGLYSLIMKSRKPEAKKFKKWVTAEVLPSLRKTGAYVMPGAEINARALPDVSNPVAAARAWAEQYEQREALALENKTKAAALAIAAPKAEALDRLYTADGCLGLQAAGKALQQPPNKFVDWLRQQSRVRNESSAHAEHAA